MAFRPAQSPGQLIAAVIEHYPQPRCALSHRSAWELLVATILSAQCTDERVNLVTPVLFLGYPDAAAIANAPLGKLESVVRSTGFYRNKARHIQGAAKTILAEFGGQVPDTMEGLLRLPGVARKTANVVLGTWYGKNEGVVVDTHVARLAHRMGLTRYNDPKKIEQDLMAAVPRAAWTDFSHALIWHGRLICAARKALCDQCVLIRLCPKNGVERPPKPSLRGARKPPATTKQ